MDDGGCHFYNGFLHEIVSYDTKIMLEIIYMDIGIIKNPLINQFKNSTHTQQPITSNQYEDYCINFTHSLP